LDAVVDLLLGNGFLFVGEIADLMADLFREYAQAKPGGQDAFEDARPSFHWQGDEPPPQFGDFRIVHFRG